ncbi:MAG: hypothetical protein ACUVX8_04885 [Candidatus Zipacnadales bacterium]
MPPRRCLIVALAALLLAALIVMVAFGCRKREQLPPVFRPYYDKSEFTDLKGDPIEEIVDGLVRLGVLQHNSGIFGPDQTVERGTFIQWLVRAHNIYWRDKPSKWIRLAPVEPGVPWSYLDVMPHTDLFPYLQGMIEAGRPVGFEPPGGEYGYARNLTREQLILLRDGVVLGGAEVVAPEAELDDYRVHLRSVFQDADTITEEYLPAVAADLREGGTIALAFPDIHLGGAEKALLEPGKLVTRREAIMALSQLGAVGPKKKPRSYKHAFALGDWPPLTEAERKALEEEMLAKRRAVTGHAHDHGEAAEGEEEGEHVHEEGEEPLAPNEAENTHEHRDEH